MAGKRVEEGTQSLRANQDILNRFRLTVVRGADTGKKYEAEIEECSIGSAPGNQLVLNDPLVSRHHCVIRASADGAMLLDLGSTNGTSISGLRIEAAFLTTGAALEVGETVIRFEALADRFSTPLAEVDEVGGLIGVSAAMRRVFAAIERVAASSTPILIEGESGVGKSRLAEIVHDRGERSGELYLPLDLSAMTEKTMKTALFGGPSVGGFDRAAKGTLVIENIDQLAANLQPLLLAALERSGAGARVIATTQSDLREAVNSRRFRPELFYQLGAVKIRIPPLRERREDIPALVEAFYATVAREEDPAPSAELVERLFWRPWPGNARELRAAVERAVLLHDGEVREPSSETSAPSGFEFDPSLSYRQSKEQVVAHFERWYVEELLRRHAGNLSRAARAVRMDRSYLRELIRRHELPLPSETDG